MTKFSIAIHGGAETLEKNSVSKEQELQYIAGLETALEAGYEVLEANGTALDAVETAVRHLEDCPLFNSGRGSVFTHEGKHEMDSAIMDGETLNAGAVASISGIKNPISLARKVLEKSHHVFLVGQGALDFAESLGFKKEPPDYFYNETRYQEWQKVKDTEALQLGHKLKHDHKLGTVGAVACDAGGNLAAATSTGGLTNKYPGRVGDSPLIGCGTYANNNTCAVSCTGIGEFFIRGVIAYDLSCLIEYKGLSLHQAADKVIHERLTNIGGLGGLIALDRQGNIALPFNSEGMYRAFKKSPGFANGKEDKAVLLYKG